MTVVDSTKRSLTATATAFVDVIGPQLAIAKIADPTIIRVGETTTYSYTVTNPGDDPLSGLTVEDSPCGPLTSLGGDGNGNTLLDPGEVWSYTCTTTLTADAASVATVTAIDSRGIHLFAQDTASVRVIDPRIALAAAADATTITSGEYGALYLSCDQSGRRSTGRRRRERRHVRPGQRGQRGQQRRRQAGPRRDVAPGLLDGPV